MLGRFSESTDDVRGLIESAAVETERLIDEILEVAAAANRAESEENG